MKRMAAIIFTGLVGLLAPGPVIAPHGYAEQDRDHTLASPDAIHWLGTDSLGRDNFARFVFGGRLSLLMAAAAAVGA